MAKPAKLHEIIAIEPDLAATARKLAAEAIVTFVKKADHFVESHKELRMFDDARSRENTVDHKPLVTTVGDKLKYVQRHVVKYFDAFATKEATNQAAWADLVVDGQVIAAQVPATMLLGLETRLKELRPLYEAIPTLNPGTIWEPDTSRGAGIYKASRSETRFRTEKTPMHKVLYEATKEHPAQIERWTQDVSIGEITYDQWSGMITPAAKSKLLERLDVLVRAIKKARQRANTTEAIKLPIGAQIFNFINGNTGTQEGQT